MANSTQARKRAHQAEGHRRQNASFRSTMRTSVKKVVRFIRTGDKQAAAYPHREELIRTVALAMRDFMDSEQIGRYKMRLMEHS